MLSLLLLLLLAPASIAQEPDALSDFREQVAPIFQHHCLDCHNDTNRSGGLSLASEGSLRAGGDSGEVVVPGDPQSSYLLDLITPHEGEAEMPRQADPLAASQVAAIRRWVAAGAQWPADVELKSAAVTDTDWWSLRPLVRPQVPRRVPRVRGDRRPNSAPQRTNPIDAFVAAKHQEMGLAFSPAASRRTLIRRLYFDLLGLPPPPDQVQRFADDPDPQAYERLVDRLLASPHYGERWARHWLDVVHYGDTHGYDKDKPRPNAWPYRDYVIRSLNRDKPWSRFVQEQIAGDVLFPGTPDGIEALGFIAAGPWDFVGHVEVPESKVDGKVARHLDRDDMVRNTIKSFCSVTVGCARCHDHKFDPITQEGYYRLQAVFAALDRTDTPYFADADRLQRYKQLNARQHELSARQDELEAKIHQRAGPELAELEKRIRSLQPSEGRNAGPEFGYHSAISSEQDVTKWVQVDLGRPAELDRIVLRAALDNYNEIGAGFGFPLRYRLEVSSDPQFEEDVTLLVSREDRDVANPGMDPQEFKITDVRGRYVRLTATKLAPRKNDFILALAELQVFDGSGENIARDGKVEALDSIESPPRWSRVNLVDGMHPQKATGELDHLVREKRRLWHEHSEQSERDELEQIKQQRSHIASQLEKFPEPRLVYAGSVHHGTGNFVGTGAQGGEPRSIHLLERGDVTQPGREIGPGTLAFFESLPNRFELPAGHAEGERRAELARWITSPQNHLTWRSIVNRVWQYHFGRGIAATPNDLGRMGAQPTHPELLDFLAAEFRDSGQSLKRLHRLIVTSHTYRQASAVGDSRRAAIERALEVDADNRFLWRMNRRKLEAEAVRDAVLAVSGKLERKMGGPAFQDFVIEKPDHSPHYQYHLHDPNDPESHRRSVYRFIVRSQLHPFMNTLDCADPSLQVARRNESITPLQALTMLNNRIMVTMAEHFAARLDERDAAVEAKVDRAVFEALGRSASHSERAMLVEYARQYGMSNFCRLLFNLNEFSFVD